ncbi:MAG: type II toxin-antitoxin system RelE/ParE family toxin [Pseudomonadota bacterium]
MIKSYKNKRARLLAENRVPKGYPEDLVIRSRAMLTALNAAAELEDLRFPPGNHLEKLRGDRAGQHSVRINRQWRICFVWTDGGPENVEIVDYH